MRKSIFFAALMLYAATVSAQRFMPVVKRSAATDDIITTLPSTAKDSLYLEDTYIMSGVRLQHYTWSGHFHHLAFDADQKTIYIKNLCSEYVFNTYVKGTIDGDSIVVPTGQHVFHQDAGDGKEEADLYLKAVRINDDSTGVVVDSETANIVFYVSKNGVLRTKANVGAAYVDPTGYVLAKNISYQFEPFDSLSALVQLPAKADTLVYDLKYKTETGEPEVGTKAVVAFAGNDVYVKGLSLNVPGWIKGSLKDGLVVFPSHQYLGRYNHAADLESDYAVFFNGAKDTGESGLFGEIYATVDSVAFTYDAATKSFSTTQSVTETIGTVNPYSHMVEPSLTPSSAIGYEPAVPEAPSIQNFKRMGFNYWLNIMVPSLDVDGKPLNTDSLSYRLIVDDKPFTFSKSEYNWIESDMTELPYSYLDYQGLGSDIMNMGGDMRRITFFANHKTIAIESIYRMNGTVNVSKRYVYDVASNSGVLTGIGNVQGKPAVDGVEYVDLHGRKVSTPRHGVFVKIEKRQDGTTVTSKCVVK